MSLVHFVARPAIRQAFQDNATRVRLPFDPAHVDAVPAANPKRSSAIGTAFDYMARFLTARELRRHRPEVVVHDTGWIADEAVAMMGRSQALAPYQDYLSRVLARAKLVCHAFVAGELDDLERIATCCQYLGAVDLLYRIGSFNPEFRASAEAQRELLQLAQRFDPVRLFDPQQVCLLNPSLVSGVALGGADADLMVDSKLIDIKTTAHPNSGAPLLRQVAGYSVLQEMGGCQLGDGFDLWTGPVDEVGFYFSRHAELAMWKLQDIFPEGGFRRFSHAFGEEMKVYRDELRAKEEPALQMSM